MPDELRHRPFGEWVSLLLLWNGLGAALVLYILLYHVILKGDFATARLPLAEPFVQLWVPSLPFTTVGVMITLWRSRQIAVSRVLMIFSGAILLLWGGFIVTVLAFLGAFNG